jgi:N-acetylmuramoyl-L-alanine amidase
MHGEATGAVPNASRLVVIVSCVAAIGAMVYGLRKPPQPAVIAPEVVAPPTSSAAPPAQSTDSPPTPAPPATPSAVPSPTVTPTPGPPRVGIVAGHWGSDTGAICPDGLTEVEINLDVAQRVIYALQARGYQTDALVSIHADSCVDYPNATPPASGFKVASVVDSMVPEMEQQLVDCLVEGYVARTGMYFHANSITPHMTQYHTFYEINGRTPGAIIETGFMKKDRYLLTQRTDLVAQGIADGIVCFIEGEMP